MPRETHLSDETAMAEPDVRWHAVPREDLDWQEWDGEFVVWNGYTASTHLLGQLAGELLLALAAMPDGARADELTAALTEATHDLDGEERIAMIAAALDQFERLGLAAPENR